MWEETQSAYQMCPQRLQSASLSGPAQASTHTIPSWCMEVPPKLDRQPSQTVLLGQATPHPVHKLQSLCYKGQTHRVNYIVSCYLLHVVFVPLECMSWQQGWQKRFGKWWDVEICHRNLCESEDVDKVSSSWVHTWPVCCQCQGFPSGSLSTVNV